MTLTGLAFMASFAVGAVLAVGRHPIFGVMIYIMLVFLDPDRRWWGVGLPDLRWSLLAILLTIIGLMIHRPEPPSVPAWRQAPLAILAILLIWGLIQYLWIPDPEAQTNFLNYLWKYAVALYLIYRCAGSEKHIRWLLWTIVAGCTYLAWVAHSEYEGGRFDSFGGSGITEANAGALAMAQGFLITASLFLASQRVGKIAALFVAPFLLNALIMTISRSGFLAMTVGGLAFIAFSARSQRLRVIALAALAVPVFLSLAPPEYWSRVETIKYRGEEVRGLDTGFDRVATMNAQLRMFRDHPLGCGSDCTTRLSSSYIDSKYLNQRQDARSSHNTFLSWLVDFGVVGGVGYILLASWAILRLRHMSRHATDLPPAVRPLIPGVGACILAQLAADQFVPYMRFEIRYWMLGVVMLLISLSARRAVEDRGTAPKVAEAAAPQPLARESSSTAALRSFARRRSTMGLACLALLIIAIWPEPASAESASDEVYCRPAQADRFDYLDPRNSARLETVEKYHFNQDVQQLVRGQHGNTPADDLAFILRYVPNHYPALSLMARWQEKNLKRLGRARPGRTAATVEPAECYFLRAIEFRPADGTVYAIYGTYLHRTNKFSEAEAAYMKAEELGANNAELYYNMGLLMLDIGDVDRARTYADKAYSQGYPLPGLKDKLRGLQSP